MCMHAVLSRFSGTAIKMTNYLKKKKFYTVFNIAGLIAF